VEDHVAPVNQLGEERLVVDAVDGVVEARVLLQVRDVLYRAGREIVDDRDLVAALQISVRQVRPDEARAARDQNSQNY
jgi:hypothetical protein